MNDLSFEADCVWSALSTSTRSLLLWMSQQLSAGGRMALVGGVVRDALLGRPFTDLDIVIEGDSVAAVSRQVADYLGVELTFHTAYQNASLNFSGMTLDLVRSRRENYASAGAAPQLEPASLLADLERRDFTINAMALLVSTSGVAFFDPLNGLADLRSGLLQPLHERSFYEDASRLVRGARLAGRLCLRPSIGFLSQVPTALTVSDVTPRLWSELSLLLLEPRPYVALCVLHDWGAGDLMPLCPVWSDLDELHQTGVVIEPAIYVATFLNFVDDAELWRQRLGLGKRSLRLLASALGDRVFEPTSLEWQLRKLLRPEAYVGLRGRDLVAMGLEGREVGDVLRWLADLRTKGLVGNFEDEKMAVEQLFGRDV